MAANKPITPNRCGRISLAAGLVSFALCLTVLASPSTALDLNRLANESERMTATDPAKLMRAATAMCLYPNLDRDTLITSFGHGGWNVAGDGDWIEIDRSEVWVTLLGPADDFFCDIQGDISQAAALQKLTDLFTDTQWTGWQITASDQACRSLTHPSGLGIEITSSGNDPTCEPTPHSAIRIYYGTN